MGADRIAALEEALFAALSIANPVVVRGPGAEGGKVTVPHPGWWYCEAVREKVHEAFGIDAGPKHQGDEMDAAREKLAERIVRERMTVEFSAQARITFNAALAAPRQPEEEKGG